MLSVSELNEQAKTLLETTFSYVEVVGEISRITKHSSGHWYFTLKDENATVSCVMYKMNNAKVKFDAKDGLKVIVYAKVSLYSTSGTYQLIIQSIRPDGLGEFDLAFNQLKEKLEKERLFDLSFKKAIPKFPNNVGLITSATSAALQDMLRVFSQRWLLSKIYVFDALTQGENAPQSLIKALKKADRFGLDAIVLARGGGSKEDLWCFNDEDLARAIFEAKTPIISAVGHEIDYVISDFVADLRALTPTAAINELVPDQNAVFQYLDHKQNEFDKALNFKFKGFEQKLYALNSKFSIKFLKVKIDSKISQILNLKDKFKQSLERKILKLSLRVNSLKSRVDERENFYKITKNLVEIRKSNKIINLLELKQGDEFEIISQNSKKRAQIIKE